MQIFLAIPKSMNKYRGGKKSIALLYMVSCQSQAAAPLYSQSMKYISDLGFRFFYQILYSNYIDGSKLERNFRIATTYEKDTLVPFCLLFMSFKEMMYIPERLNNRQMRRRERLSRGREGVGCY